MKLLWIAAAPLAAAFFFPAPCARAQANIFSSEAAGIVVLPQGLNAQQLKPNSVIQTQLLDSVHLSNGTVLPKGTRLLATVTEDNMHRTGRNRLSLRFTEAQPRKGKEIPIKATILDIATRKMPVQNDPSDLEVPMNAPSTLDGAPNVVTEAVETHVDLNSNAASKNSGLLLSVENNIKLPAGTKMELALAPRTSM